MSLWVEVAIFGLCLAGAAVFAGGETAFYRVSRVRIEMEARQGKRTARLARALLSDETALVIVLVLGLNLCVEILTHRLGDLLAGAGLSRVALEIVVTLVLTPILFFFGELLPKDLARRRPHAALAVAAPIVLFARGVFWPIERAMWLFTALVSRALALEPRLFSSGQGREQVMTFLLEGTKSGAIPKNAELMARNVLKLRSIPIQRCMVPWKDANTLDASASEADLYAAVSRSQHTRLLVVGTDGECLGYVHQLDALGAGPDEPVLSHLRDVVELEPLMPVDRALARLRASGQRLAVVGTRRQPLGLLTLKDLLEEISGDLAGW